LKNGIYDINGQIINQMQDIHKNKLLTELLTNFKNDIPKSLNSLSSKIKLDVFPKIVETIETDDATEVEEAKLFLKNATSVIINDIKEQLTDFLENYQTG